MQIKSNIIKRLNPLRKFYNGIYTFILAAYLGKTIVVLNQVDHTFLNWIFYFFVFDAHNKPIEFHRVVSTKTMGTKVAWLKSLHKGKDLKFNKAELKLTSRKIVLVNNPIVEEMIYLLQNIIDDTRNPLVHSHYLL